MSESVEMYLKTLFELGMGGEPVAISAVARRLGVSSVSATEMIKRLEQQGYVIHLPYKGVELTETGASRARAVQRRHRLWECFLFNHLGIEWELTHDYACTLEHLSSDEVTQALSTYLDHPQRCPHGNRIHYTSDEVSESEQLSMIQLEIGDTAVINSIYPEETPILLYLKNRGIFPGSKIIIEDLGPYNGPITIRSGDQIQVVDRTTASFVHVTLQS